MTRYASELLDPDMGDAEALNSWEALPQEAKDRVSFMAARRAAIESRKTNGRVNDHEERITKQEHRSIVRDAVTAAAITAAPFVFVLLNRAFPGGG